MKILLTGGAGFIGSHTLVELIKDGHECVVVDNFSNSSINSIKRVEIITGIAVDYYGVDLCDYESIKTVFSKHSFDVVVHFAGLKSVGESVLNPTLYYKVNLQSTLNLIECMRVYGCFSLIFSSSATVYGRQENMPIKEDSALQTTNPYGHTKLIIEDILRALHLSDQRWRIILLRYFNPVGAHESGLIGEAPASIPSNLFPYITQVAVGLRQELEIYGNDYPTVDGTGVRDYIHVSDLALGHLKAVAFVKSLAGVNAVNLGTGRGHSVLEVLSAFEKTIGNKIKFKYTKRRPGDVAECYADVSKARNVFNWSAVCGLSKMVEDSWRWQKNSLNKL